MLYFLVSEVSFIFGTIGIFGSIDGHEGLFRFVDGHEGLYSNEVCIPPPGSGRTTHSTRHARGRRVLLAAVPKESEMTAARADLEVAKMQV